MANAGRLPNDFDRDRPFVPFQRGVDARGSGVGLGLYIADRLARSLDGWLDVAEAESPDGPRVAFTVRFPAVRPDPGKRVGG